MELAKLIFEERLLVLAGVESVYCLLVVELLLDDFVIFSVEIEQIDVLFNQ